jgi:DHA2 family multidrug resistance protein-like MFS transporter
VTEDSIPSGPKATRREWIGLAVLALPCLLYSMDLTVLNLAVPHLSADLKPSASQLLWIVDIYGFLIAGSLITMGTLGDRFGRRKLLLIGSAAFGSASVLAAFANSAEQLIAARALLGVAGATLAPSTLSLLRNMFHDPKQRTFAIGVWIASFSAGGAIGPLFGGFLIEHFWWGSVFLANVPVMLLLLAVGPFLLPEYRDPAAGKLDIASAALSLAAVLSAIYGVKHLAEHGLSWLPFACIALGGALAALFVRRQRRLASPLIDLKLFSSHAFRSALMINVLGFCSVFSAFLFVSQYLQLVLGMGPLEAGLWTAPSGLAFVVGSMTTPFLLRVMRPAYAMTAGLMVSASGFLLLASSGGQLAPLVTGFVVLSIGLSPVVTLTTDIIISSVPPEKAGAASGVAETSTELGGALGIALLGSLSTAIYRHDMSEAALAGVPAAAAETARSTLGGAVAVADMLPAGLADAVLHSSSLAFTEAFAATMSVGAALTVSAGILATLLLRHARQGGESAHA